MELIRTPKDWNELTEIIRDMRGSESDLARVAIMAYQLGKRDGSECRYSTAVDEIENALAQHEWDKETP